MDMIIKRIPFSAIEAEQEWAEKEGQAPRKRRLCVQDRQPTLLTVEHGDRTSFVLLENYHLFKQYVSAGIKEALCVVQPASSLHQRLLKRIHLELNVKRSTGYDIPKMLIYLLRLGYSVDRIAAEAHSAVTALQPIVLRQRAQIKKQQRMKMAAEQRLTIYPFDFMEHAVYIPGMLAWPYQEPAEDEWLEMDDYPTK
jgi:hypothetical protein